MTVTRASRQAGFALPLTIFVLMLVTVLLAALMVQVQTDRRIAESSGDLVEALVVAQSGLESYVAHYDSLALRPSNGDSLRVNTVGGYADVIAYVVHQPADTLYGGIDYILRSRGRLIRPTLGADPQAVRVVSQFARWEYGTVKVIGAFSAVDGFRCNGASCGGTYLLTGHDQCLVETSVPALRVPTGATPVLGPPEADPATVEGPNRNAFVEPAFIGVDWSMIENGAFDPDYRMLSNLNSWSSYLLDGDVTLTDIAGAGLLVILGDATLAGSAFDWRGVVVVGGHVIFEADTSRITGALLSGLNHQTGTVPGSGSWGDAGTHLEVIYNSCATRNAFRSLTGFAPVPGAWMDRWASF
jgi:type II secretory pathway pseudopilin PulG